MMMMMINVRNFVRKKRNVKTEKKTCKGFLNESLSETRKTIWFLITKTFLNFAKTKGTGESGKTYNNP